MATTSDNNQNPNPVAESTVRDDSLPKNFDLLIVGTGLVESIVSAAVSRNGHTVLHIDSRDYYGGTWGTFGLDQWTSASFMEVPEEVKADVKITAKDGSPSGKVKWHNQVGHFEQVWYEDEEEDKENMMKLRRRFNIDLMPKLIAAREDITELLITSNVSRYLEFLRISRILTNFPAPNETELKPIPLSRADIFTSKSLSLVEKRSLVKFIEAVLKVKPAVGDLTQEDPDQKETTDEVPEVPQTFDELVSISKASEKVKQMVKSSVTLLDDGFSLSEEKFNQEFCERCRLFLSSIGRYGNQTPFLWTLYGISEICQAFCRLSAVYGGIFILKRYLSSIGATEGGYIVKTDTDEVNVKNILLGPELKCDIIGKDRSKKEHSSILVGRAVLITIGGHIQVPEASSKSKGDGVFLYRISGLEVIELNYISQAVPNHDYDFHLLQISFPILKENSNVDASYCKNHVERVLDPFVKFKHTDSQSSGEEGDFADVVQGSDKCKDSRPHVIYGAYFTLTFDSDTICSERLVHESENESKHFIIESGLASTDLTTYVSKARQIFHTLYPDEEFLPKAPDCEDPDQVNGDVSPTIEIENENTEQEAAAEESDPQNSNEGNRTNTNETSDNRALAPAEQHENES